MNRKNIFLCLLVTYSFGIFSADIPLLKLEDQMIATEKARISADFTKRGYLAKASYAALAAGTLWFAYKWGMFDYFKTNKPAEVSPPLEVPVAIPVEQITSGNVLAMVATLQKNSVNQATKIIEQSKELELLKQKNLEGKMHWLIEGAKYVGLTGFSILGGIVVQSKWQNLFNYALAEPTFDWFYGSHSMLNRIDSLRYHIANSIDTTGATPQASLDFHHDAIAPTLDTVHKNLKELIAFSEYYFDNLDAAIVAQCNLDGAPRYLFNTANDFFDAVKDAIDAQDRAKALALTDAFRAELTNYNKDCQSFENTVLN
jgi:hypothetical protein